MDWTGDLDQDLDLDTGLDMELKIVLDYLYNFRIQEF